MSRKIAIPEQWCYWLSTLVLAAIAVTGALGTPEISQCLIPRLYYESQEFWTGRQTVYAERDIVYTSSSLVFLQDMLRQPLEERPLRYSDEALRTALRKMVARKQRALEKANLLKFKYERIKRMAAEALGQPREPQAVEGL